MANILQAVQWMREGKQVRRESMSYWKLKFKPGPHGIQFLEANEEYVPEITANDLVAEDWEICE